MQIYAIIYELLKKDGGFKTDVPQKVNTSRSIDFNVTDIAARNMMLLLYYKRGQYRGKDIEKMVNVTFKKSDMRSNTTYYKSINILENKGIIHKHRNKSLITINPSYLKLYNHQVKILEEELEQWFRKNRVEIMSASHVQVTKGTTSARPLERP